MTTAMNHATMARVLNPALTVATDRRVRRKPPGRKARIRVRVLHNPDGTATTVARARLHLRTATHKVVTMTANSRVNLKKITNHAPMRTWAHKAVSMPSATNPAAAQAVSQTRP